MAARVDTDQILEGALRCIRRMGLQKLAMVDVAEEAGISRHTLARRFPTQEAMLDALGDYVVRRFEADLRQAIAARPSPRARIGVVTALAFDQMRKDTLGRLLELEPRFFRRFLRVHFAECVRSAAAMLVWPEPLPAGPRGRALIDAAELILRYGISLEVAEAADWTRQTELVVRTVEAMLAPGREMAVA